MTANDHVCPPHHWLVESREIDHQIVDHHQCVRCGMAKATPRPASNSWPAARGAATAAARPSRPGRAAPAA